MNYEPKKCHFCHSSDIRKHGIRNNIQRYECNACNKTFTLKKKLNPPLSRDLNIIADTTFFGREFGILVLMDSLSKKVVYHRVIKTEKDVYYRIAFNSLRMKGYNIQSITCDGIRGILKDLLDTPTQMCHFHMVAIVMRALRKKHQSIAGKELKFIALTLKQSAKKDVYLRLHHWYLKHKAFLEERSETE
ncbi:transposase [Glaesserella parasuis]|uniref:transposase n=1 Tax=Glaesserella parasuis TaxID=738 RepID=UPI003C702425